MAYSPSKKIGAVLAIIRDNQGKVIIGKARRIHISSSLVAEAIALREGLLLVRSSFCESIVLESDCLQLI